MPTLVVEDRATDESADERTGDAEDDRAEDAHRVPSGNDEPPEQSDDQTDDDGSDDETQHGRFIPKPSILATHVIELTDEMRERLSNALADGYPVVAASVESSGYPKLSFFGSAQVYSKDQLAVWHRAPEGGLLDRIADHPQMSVLYRHGGDRTSWQFYGRAHVDDSDEVRQRVYDAMPEIERMLDAERKGRAVIIDVDRVSGRNLEMRRD